MLKSYYFSTCKIRIPERTLPRKWGNLTTLTKRNSSHSKLLTQVLKILSFEWQNAATANENWRRNWSRNCSKWSLLYDKMKQPPLKTAPRRVQNDHFCNDAASFLLKKEISMQWCRFISEKWNSPAVFCFFCFKIWCKKGLRQWSFWCTLPSFRFISV